MRQTGVMLLIKGGMGKGKEGLCWAQSAAAYSPAAVIAFVAARGVEEIEDAIGAIQDLETFITVIIGLKSLAADCFY